MNVEKTYTVRDLQEDYQAGRIRDFSDLERAIERMLRGGKVQESFRGTED